MIEHCIHCQAEAPPWDAAEYALWHLGVDERGVYIGVVCEGCFAGEDIVFVGHVPLETAQRLTLVASGPVTGSEPQRRAA